MCVGVRNMLMIKLVQQKHLLGTLLITKMTPFISGNSHKKIMVG